MTPSVKTVKKAYADDLTLCTQNPRDNQLVLDLTNNWLKWSQTMRAKPSNCIAIGFKLFSKTLKQKNISRLLRSLLLLLISA